MIKSSKSAHGSWGEVVLWKVNLISEWICVPKKEKHWRTTFTKLDLLNTTAAAAAFYRQTLTYKMILVLLVQVFTRREETVKYTQCRFSSYLWRLQPQGGALDSRLLRDQLQQRRHSALYLWHPHSLNKDTRRCSEREVVSSLSRQLVVFHCKGDS